MFAPFPLVRHLLFLILGILTYQQTHWYHTSIWIGVGVACAAAALAMLTRWQWLRGAFLLLAVFGTGWGLAHLRNPLNQPGHFNQYEVILAYQATVVTYPEQKPKTYKTEAEVVAVKTPEGWQPSTGRLLLYLPLSIEAKPRYGDTYFVNGPPRIVEPPKNPLEFNYKRYLELKGIVAHQFIRDGEYKFLANRPPNRLQQLANAARTWADSAIRRYVPAAIDYPVVNAMLIGLRDEVSPELQESYAATGAVHILSVSGMHVAMLYGLLLLLVRPRSTLYRQLNAWLGRQNQQVPQKQLPKLMALLVIILLWAYALLTGFTPSVVRSVLMFSILQVATLVGRKNMTLNTLAFSALILLFYQPNWLYDVGFQLSYLAVWGIFWMYPLLIDLLKEKPRPVQWLWGTFAVSLSAQLLTFPVSLYYFHQFPNYFFIANVFVGILSALIMYFGLAMLFFAGFWSGAATVFGWGVSGVLWLMNKGIQAVQHLPGAVSTGFSPSILETIWLYLILFGLIVFFQYRKFPYLVIGAILGMGLFGYHIYKDIKQQHNKELTLHFIPRQSAISFIDGKQAVLLTNAALLKDPRAYGFHFKNYYDSLGITQLKTHAIDSLAAVVLLNFNSSQILWVRQRPHSPIQVSPDTYIMVSNNAIRNLDFLISPPKALVIDHTNSKYNSSKLAHLAQERNWPSVSLYETGSYTLYPKNSSGKN